MWDLSLGLADSSFWWAGFSLVAACGLFPPGMWDLSSLTRVQTQVPCIAGKILNHWTTRKVPSPILLFPTKMTLELEWAWVHPRSLLTTSVEIHSSTSAKPECCYCDCCHSSSKVFFRSFEVAGLSHAMLPCAGGTHTSVVLERSF